MTTVCFLWHMHQPFYKDLWSGEYKLPWTRLHAMKDYAGMVEILADFPAIHQTFNLVPSMIAQIEEYASGKASDPFLDCALARAEDLSEAQRNFVLKYFFQANFDRLISRYPRYLELFRKQERKELFSPQDLRDLQIFHLVVWFDEDVLARDPELIALVRKGRDFSLADQTNDRPQAAGSAGARTAGLSRIQLTRTNRNFHDAVLPSDPAVDLRFRSGRGFEPRTSAAAALLVSR